jgi:hypothetical protein
VNNNDSSTLLVLSRCQKYRIGFVKYRFSETKSYNFMFDNNFIIPININTRIQRALISIFITLTRNHFMKSRKQKDYSNITVCMCQETIRDLLMMAYLNNVQVRTDRNPRTGGTMGFFAWGEEYVAIAIAGLGTILCYTMPGAMATIHTRLPVLYFYFWVKLGGPWA